MLPYFMAMGMKPDEFWHGDPYLCQSYSLAFSIRREEEDYQAWLHGLYVYDAVSKAMHNAFRGKDGEYEPYVEKPMLAFKKEKNQSDDDEPDELTLAKAEVWMMNFFNGL